MTPHHETPPRRAHLQRCPHEYARAWLPRCLPCPFPDCDAGVEFCARALLVTSLSSDGGTYTRRFSRVSETDGTHTTYSWAEVT